MRGKNRNTVLVIFIVVMGAVIGSALGYLLEGVLPAVITNTYELGLKSPVHLDLMVMNLTFGLLFKISIVSIIGMILSIFIARKI
jgi:membrane protein YqaA with SNARE-associated domain